VVDADPFEVYADIVARGPAYCEACSDTCARLQALDNSLVDPDNRRPVDFTVRRAPLARLDTGWLPLADDAGAAKLLLVS
jgi:maltooligosyltrehalose synthase